MADGQLLILQKQMEAGSWGQGEAGGPGRELPEVSRSRMAGHWWAAGLTMPLQIRGQTGAPLKGQWKARLPGAVVPTLGGTSVSDFPMLIVRTGTVGASYSHGS